MATKIMHGELIGKHVKVVDATNKDLANLEGLVVDETKNLVMIQTRSGVKKVQKQAVVEMKVSTEENKLAPKVS